MASRAPPGVASAAASPLASLLFLLLLQPELAGAARVDSAAEALQGGRGVVAREVGAQAAQSGGEEAAVQGARGGPLYAFVVKYTMEQMYGFEIAHTSLVVAPRSAVEVEVGKFEKWCGSLWRKQCFKESGWEVEQPMILPETAMEYEFFQQGVEAIKYGTSAISQDFKKSRLVYPVGPVTESIVAEALEKAKSCGQTADGYLLDYNLQSYHVIEHNSHTFIDTMLHLLGLPYWYLGSGLPSGFMPENKARNPITGRIVAKLLGGSLSPFSASKACGGTCCDGDASGGIDLGLDFSNITF